MSLRPIPSRADARENRIRVLDAAREVLAERGLSAEINDIATRAGVGTGTIYRNYESKEAVVLEIAREMANKTNLELLAAANLADPRESVARVMQVGFQRCQRFMNAPSGWPISRPLEPAR